jgi:tetratricopeptide (TPR) repeat protein
MSQDPEFDVARAHRHFAAACFNEAWEYLDRPDRTPEDVERMLGVAHASVWHWTRRDDCTPRNLSIGYWQLSRVYAVAGEFENARKYARLCLAITPADETFCLGYAHEAAARAEQSSGDTAAAREHLAEAQRLAAAITEEGERQALLADLDAIEAGSR